MKTTHTPAATTSAAPSRTAGQGAVTTTPLASTTERLA